MALAAVSCSNEEVVSVNNDANEIKFSAVAENATRAQNVFCNVNLPTEFHVWAAVNKATYFEKVQYKKDASGVYKAKGGEVHFWPTSGTAVDFYAVTEETKPYKAAVPGEPETPAVPAEYFDWTNTATHAFNWNAAGGSTITWETRNFNAPQQTDLLYAYTNKSRPAGTAGVVAMNFRHALSQIVFKAQNTNKTIAVEIDKVDVVNIAKGGTFTMPSVVTDGNIEDHTTGGTYPEDNSVGEWSGWSAQSETYTTYWTPATKIKSDLTNLTNDENGVNKQGTEGQEGYVAAAHPQVAHSLLLVPQETTAWVPGSPKKPTESTGSYFVVYCRIKNVAASDGNATATDLYLWGNAGATAAVYIPFKADWDPGKKYIYTFKFGENTNGGYDPNGDPVLIPISFTVTVDDFVKVTTANDNIPME